jgi:hypothetical protein
MENWKNFLNEEQNLLDSYLENPTNLGIPVDFALHPLVVGKRLDIFRKQLEDKYEKCRSLQSAANIGQYGGVPGGFKGPDPGYGLAGKEGADIYKTKEEIETKLSEIMYKLNKIATTIELKAEKEGVSPAEIQGEFEEEIYALQSEERKLRRQYRDSGAEFARAIRRNMQGTPEQQSAAEKFEDDLCALTILTMKDPARADFAVQRREEEWRRRHEAVNRKEYDKKRRAVDAARRREADDVRRANIETRRREDAARRREDAAALDARVRRAREYNK